MVPTGHATTDHIEPRFGHPKDRRPDLLQVQAGLAVSADGGIPIWHRAYDGGAGEVAQVVPAHLSISTPELPVQGIGPTG